MKELGSESPMESLFDIRSLEAITGGEPAALQRLLETLLASSRDDRTRLAELPRSWAYPPTISRRTGRAFGASCPRGQNLKITLKFVYCAPKGRF